MSTYVSFAELMKRLEAGDGEAADVVFRLYAQRLIALARKHLDARCRAVLSGSDIALEVLNSFFRRQVNDPFDLDNEDALWALLAEMTLRKCGKWYRHFAARKRSVPTLSLDPAEDSEASWQARDLAPTPQEIATLTDTVALLYQGLKDNERQICELRLQGYKVGEIADQLNLSLETVYRKIGRIRTKLERLIPVGE
jgi:RNA polymerase sigma factor (sigma-70 family)